MPPNKPRLTREEALQAKPMAMPVVKREPLPGGGERVTVRHRPTSIQKWLLRAPDSVARHYELDAMGVEVLEMCDGRKTVHFIIEAFAQRHKVNSHEAECAVTTFLFTMLRKGLVAMVVSA